MKFYISADIEGVGGLGHFDSGTEGNFDYGEARRWMTDEVIAASEGAREAGCNEVIVSDSHFNGRNIIPDQLPDYVRLVRCWPRPLGMVEGVQEPGVIGAALLGYHVGAAAPKGLCPHTLNGGMISDIRLDGGSISETHVSAYTAGECEVPVIFASGDNYYTEHASSLIDGVEAITVKDAISHTAATCLSPARSCELIREGARRAVTRRKEIPLTTREWPATMEILFKGNRMAELMAMLPHFERVNGFTVSVRVNSAKHMSTTLTFVMQMLSLRR